MGVVDIQIAKKIIAENFAEDKDEREKAFSIYLTKPYQTIHDSPTIKYYTDWNLYDSLNINNISLQKVCRTEDKYLINIKDDDIIIGKDVNVDDNIKDGILNIDEHKLVSLSLSLSRRITIKESGQYYIKHTITKPNYFSPSHLIIEVPKDIEIKLIYEVSNFADNSLVSPLISINIEEGGKLDFQFINLSGNNSLLFSYIKANIKGKLDSSIFINGAKMAHVEFITKLWENSISNFSSRALGTYNNRIDIVNNVIHLGERSSSNGNMKAISNDQAFTVVRGTASINETAIDSSTSIIGRSLILGKEAKAVVSPMLEVKTGRVVMAKHSASITRIDENQIFYLQSRGFNKKEAEGLIIRGFIIEEQDPEGLKNKIEEILTSLGY